MFLRVFKISTMQNLKSQYKTYTPQRLDVLTIRYNDVTRSSNSEVTSKTVIGNFLMKLSRLAANPFKV